MPKKTAIILAGVAGVLLVLGAATGVFFAVDRSALGDEIRSAFSSTYVQADVDAALLTPADVPEYTPEPSGDSDDESDLAPCNKPVNLEAMGQKGTDRTATFARSELGPFLLHIVGLLEEDSDLGPLRDAFTNCPRWTDENGDTFEFTPAEYGTYGDETFSGRIRVSSQGIDVTLSLVAIRQGNLLSIVMLAGIPDVPAPEVESVASKAAAKLPD